MVNVKEIAKVLWEAASRRAQGGEYPKEFLGPDNLLKVCAVGVVEAMQAYEEMIGDIRSDTLSTEDCGRFEDVMAVLVCNCLQIMAEEDMDIEGSISRYVRKSVSRAEEQQMRGAGRNNE